MNGTVAADAITPVCFALTGLAGKCARAFWKALAVVAHPGDDDDPAVRQSRGLWIRHQSKLHSITLVRHLDDLMARKSKQIRREFAASYQANQVRGERRRRRRGRRSKTSAKDFLDDVGLPGVPLPEQLLPAPDLGLGVQGLNEAFVSLPSL